VNLFGSLSARRPSYVDDDNQKRTNNLPQVPKASLQSLETIFRNFNRTQRNDANINLKPRTVDRRDIS
jgi:hypothetical protein